MTFHVTIESFLDAITLSDSNRAIDTDMHGATKILYLTIVFLSELNGIETLKCLNGSDTFAKLRQNLHQSSSLYGSLFKFQIEIVTSEHVG